MQEIFGYVFATAFVLLPTLILPCAIALLFTRKDWKIVGIAYAIWFGLLVLYWSQSEPNQDGGAIALAMIYSIIVVPVLSVFLKILSILKKLWLKFRQQLINEVTE